MATESTMATDEGELEEIRLNYLDESSARWLYAELAACDGDSRRAGLLGELATYEAKHAGAWEGLLRKAGAAIPAPAPSLEHRLFVLLARLFGVGAILPLLHKTEVDGIAKYKDQARRWQSPEARAAILDILPEEVVHEVDLFDEARQLQASGGALRSTILGANDGLGSILALVAGVAGATESSQTVIVAGIAGLAAGAASMGASNYTSVKAEQEVYLSMLRLQREAVLIAPGTKREQLKEAYMRRGLSDGEAEAVADRTSADPERFARALLAEERGVTEATFESPTLLAAYTGAAFLASGLIPVLPYLFLPVGQATLASVALTGAALFLAGMIRALSTLHPFLRSGLEMVLVGLGSAGATWVIGRMVGVILE